MSLPEEKKEAWMLNYHLKYLKLEKTIFRFTLVAASIYESEQENDMYQSILRMY